MSTDRFVALQPFKRLRATQGSGFKPDFFHLRGKQASMLPKPVCKVGVCIKSAWEITRNNQFLHQCIKAGHRWLGKAAFSVP